MGNCFAEDSKIEGFKLNDNSISRYQTTQNETIFSHQRRDEDYLEGEFFTHLLHLFEDIDKCEVRKKYFYETLGNRIGELYSLLLKKMQEKAMEGNCDGEEIKISFSKLILLNLLNLIGKLQNMSCWNTEKIHVFSNIAKRQKRVIEFLKYKYPRNKKHFIPKEIADMFQELNDSEHTDNDLLINTKVFFDEEAINSYQRNEVIRKIKEFLNCLINETNRFYNHFHQQMQLIFEGLDGSFKIGRKIPENVSKYTDTESSNFQINSPQIFRVIIKWISSLEGIFINSLEQLKNIKYFKIVQKDEEEINYFPMYTGKSELISLLISELEQRSKDYRRQVEDQELNLYNFNDNLTKVLDKKNNIPQIDRNEIKTIKYASYLSKFIGFLAIDKLVYMIIQLTKLRVMMEKKCRKSIDLIKCDVTDLLRCQFVGGKSEIIKAFNNLRNLQKKHEIKITRIKNRFSTPLNDCLINFMFIGNNSSFIVCEIQLILASTNYEANLKDKSYQNLNHFLYELERSIFGPMSEMSLLLTHHDTRMGFEKKIKLEKILLERLKCPEQMTLDQQYELPLPYVCSLCSQFYAPNENSFPIHRCLNCNFYVCPLCFFQYDYEESKKNFGKEIANYLKSQLHQFEDTQDNEYLFFNNDYLKVGQVKSNKKNILNSLQQIMFEKEIKYAFIFQFIDGKRKMSAYTNENGYIIPTFYDFLPRSVRKQWNNMEFGKYDIILFLNQKIQVQKKAFKDQALNTYYFPQIQMTKKFQDIYQFTWNKIIYVIDVGGEVRQNQTLSLTTRQAQEKILEYEKTLSLYKPIEGRLQLDYLDLDDFGSKLATIEGVRFAKVTSNRLKNIDQLFRFKDLEEVGASRNDLIDINFSKKTPKLRIIDLSENFLERVNGLNSEYLPNLKELNIKGNNFTEFPQIELKKLLWLDISSNKIDSSGNAASWRLPKVRKINCSSNLLKGFPDIHFPQLLDFECNNNLIEKFIDFENCKKVEKICLNKNKIPSLESLNLPELQRIEIRANKIKDLSSFVNSELNKLTYLDLSQNKIQKIPKIGFEALQELNLSKNSIEDLDEFVRSEDLVNLKKLILSYNSLSTLPMMNFECLEYLDLTTNKIVYLDELLSSNLPTLLSLDLRKNQIQELPQMSFPQLVTLNLQMNKIEDICDFTGSDVPKLKILNLSKNEIKKFYSAQFPSLEEYIIQFNQITEIDQIKVQHLEACKILDISNNKIEKLPRMFLQSVENLFLSQNEICNLSKFRHSQCPNLKKLDLRNNKIPKFPRMTLQKLEILELSSNSINEMTGISKSQLPKLQQLYLTNNLLQEVQVLKLERLCILKLDQNKLENVTALESYQTPEITSILLQKNNIKCLCSLKSSSLMQLNLSTNNLVNIDHFGRSSDLPKLLSLKINNNRLQQSFPAFHFPALKTLEVCKNQIDNIQQFISDSELPKLDTAKFNNNIIRQVGEFNNTFKQLKILDLSKNRIENIDDFSYSALPKLHSLSIQNNCLTSLPKLCFKKLLHFSVDNNTIKNLDEFNRSNLPNLEKLEVKSNKLKQFPVDLVLQRLLKLNLSDNELTSFKNINKETVPNLQELYLRRNKIEEVHEVNLPQLTHLYIDGNFITETNIKIISKFIKTTRPQLKIAMDKQNSNRENKENIILNTLKSKVSLA